MSSVVITLVSGNVTVTALEVSQNCFGIVKIPDLAPPPRTEGQVSVQSTVAGLLR